MSRVLVTGATGFIGANVVRRLVKSGHELRALVRGESDPWRLEGLLGADRWYRADIRDREAIRGVVQAVDPEVILHLAAWGGRVSEDDHHDIVETNVMGTLNLLDAGIQSGVGCFVNAGSSSEYGFKDHAPSETERLEPNSMYSAAKGAASLLCRYANGMGTTDVVTLRFYSIYGPWETPSRLVPRLVSSAMRGELPPLAAPEAAHDFVHVDDAVESVVRVMDASQKGNGGLAPVYNIATGRQTTLAELVEIAREVLVVNDEPVWGSMERRGWDADVWVGDARLIEQDLGWRPSVSLTQGLRATADWLISQPSAIQRRYLG